MCVILFLHLYLWTSGCVAERKEIRNLEHPEKVQDAHEERRLCPDAFKTRLRCPEEITPQALCHAFAVQAETKKTAQLN